MDDHVYNKIENMVKSFRVSELQTLLGYAGRNKSGRKNELLARALQLVHRNCSSAVEMRVYDLYKKSESFKQKSPVKNSNQSFVDINSYDANTGIGLGMMDYMGENQALFPNTNIIRAFDVTLKPLPFYETIDTVLLPICLLSTTVSKVQETCITFKLSLHQIELLKTNTLNIQGTMNNTVQIQLRFCLMETSCEQKDEFPPNCSVRINHKLVPLPPPILTNKQESEIKRPNKPVNITLFCKLDCTLTNTMTIGWSLPSSLKKYCVSINIVSQQKSDCLLNKLKEKGFRHPDHTRALIKEKLMPDKDTEIAVSSLRVTLQCPLGKMRIQIPCRSKICKHLQCFDASTYIMMNEKRSTWQCPVCDKHAEYKDLIIDGYFVEILRECPRNIDEIEFFDDGSWQTLNKKNTDSIHDYKKKSDISSKVNYTVIDDSNSPKQSNISNKNNESKVNSIQCFDLTESTDEEDVEPETVLCFSDTQSLFSTSSDSLEETNEIFESCLANCETVKQVTKPQSIEIAKPPKKRPRKENECFNNFENINTCETSLPPKLTLTDSLDYYFNVNTPPLPNIRSLNENQTNSISSTTRDSPSLDLLSLLSNIPLPNNTNNLFSHPSMFGSLEPFYNTITTNSQMNINQNNSALNSISSSHYNNEFTLPSSSTTLASTTTTSSSIGPLSSTFDPTFFWDYNRIFQRNQNFLSSFDYSSMPPNNFLHE